MKRFALIIGIAVLALNLIPRSAPAQKPEGTASPTTTSIDGGWLVGQWTGEQSRPPLTELKVTMKFKAKDGGITWGTHAFGDP